MDTFTLDNGTVITVPSADKYTGKIHITLEKPSPEPTKLSASRFDLVVSTNELARLSMFLANHWVAK